MVAVLEDVASFTFLERFVSTNTPCLVRGGGLKLPLEWSDTDGINWMYLKSNFGSVSVPVEQCTEDGYSERKRQVMTFSEYIDAYKKSNNGCSLYLKDWHFFRDFPNCKEFQKSIYFTFDWLNEYWDQRKDVADDYRFVYFGPAGTSTPFHVDILRSYSWSVNVHGCKEWILVPPGLEMEIKDNFGNFPHGITNQELLDKLPGSIRVLQREKEVLFVPSGWHHQVTNLDDTLSINNNWCNAWNVENVWIFLSEELLQVQKEIKDLKDIMDDWPLHCQVLLRANCGMNYMEFCEILLTVGLPRYVCFQELCTGKVPAGDHVDHNLVDRHTVTGYKETLEQFCHHSYGKNQTLSRDFIDPLPSVESSVAKGWFQHDKGLLQDMQIICYMELMKIEKCLVALLQSPDFQSCSPSLLLEKAKHFQISLHNLL